MAVGREREAGQGVVRGAVNVQIAPHQQSRLRRWGQALHRLMVGVGCHRQGRVDRGADAVCQLLDAHHQCAANLARGDGQEGLAKGDAAGGAGGLEGRGFDAAQPGEVGDQHAEMRLAGERRRQHVADEQRVGLQAAGVLDSQLDGLQCQMPQRDLPMLTYRRHAGAGNHNGRVGPRRGRKRHVVASLPRKRA